MKADPVMGGPLDGQCAVRDDFCRNDGRFFEHRHDYVLFQAGWQDLRIKVRYCRRLWVHVSLVNPEEVPKYE